MIIEHTERTLEGKQIKMAKYPDATMGRLGEI